MGHYGGLGDKKWDIFRGQKMGHHGGPFFLGGQKMGHYGGLGDKKWDIFFLRGQKMGHFFSLGDKKWDITED